MREEQDRIFVNGTDFADLEVCELESARQGMWEFLTRLVPLHPWIAGIASIVGIVTFNNNQLPWVQIVAIAGVTLITVVSTWKRSSNGRPKEANEFGNVGANAISDRSLEGYLRQRFSVGSDPPIGGTSRNTD